MTHSVNGMGHTWVKEDWYILVHLWYQNYMIIDICMEHLNTLMFLTRKGSILNDHAAVLVAHRSLAIAEISMCIFEICLKV